MSRSTPAGETFKLELVDDVPRSVTEERVPVAEPAVARPTVAAAAPSVHGAASFQSGGDPFLAQAIREREGGVVDAALWSRSLLLAGGDDAAAVGPYLRARATALKLAQRRASPATPQSAAGPSPAAGGATKRRPGYGSKPVVFALAAVAVIAVLTVVWALWWPSADAPTSQAAPAGQDRAPAAPGTRSAPGSAAAPAATSEPDPSVELAAKVAALRQAGNWNVLVLYASEWTRKAPGQAAAWLELSEGYTKLHQPDDALAAARKAAELEPSNPVYQRHLARLYEELNRPAEAIVAVEKALSADDRHVASLAQAGRLYLALTRLDEARVAFDRALALDASNTASACGALEVARRQARTKDADALAKALKAAQIDCPESSRAAVPVGASPASAATPAARSIAPAGRT